MVTCEQCGGERSPFSGRLCKKCYMEGTGRGRVQPDWRLQPQPMYAAPVSFTKLEQLVVRPGIEDKLLPLALYRGNLSLSDIQKRWNLFLGLYLKEAETLRAAHDFWGHRDTNAALCLPNMASAPQELSLRSFASRLRAHPKITDSISKAFTEYIEHICPHPFVLEPIPRHSYSSLVPWRFKARPKQVRKWKSPELRAADLCYPYLIHKPEAPPANNGMALVMKIDAAVPKRLPEQFRADVCQDLAMAILSGEMQESELDGSVKEYIKKVWDLYPSKWTHVSLNAPPPWKTEGRTFAELLEDKGWMSLGDAQEEFHDHENWATV